MKILHTCASATVATLILSFPLLASAHPHWGRPFAKHQFCVRNHAGSSIFSKNCWSRLAGDAGRADCAVRLNGGYKATVGYGKCK